MFPREVAGNLKLFLCHWNSDVGMDRGFHESELASSSQLFGCLRRPT
jgi:hypothetical protein